MLNFQEIKEILTVANYINVKETQNERIVSACNKYNEPRTFILTKVGQDKVSKIIRYTLRSVEMDQLIEVKENHKDAQLIECNVDFIEKGYRVIIFDIYIKETGNYEKNHPEVITQSIHMML